MTQTKGHRSARKPALWTRIGEEPRLQEVLSDPISDLIRARDGISLSQVCTAVQQARMRLMINQDSACPVCA